MRLTYRKLAEIIDSFTEEQKNMDVTYRTDMGEYFQGHDVGISGATNPEDEQGILDEGHPYIETSA